MSATVDGAIRQELLEASDELIDEVVEYADPVCLRGLLYQLTGDEELAAAPVKWSMAGFAHYPMLEREEDVRMLRRKAAAFLKAYRDSGAGSIDPGARERVPESVSLVACEPIEGDALSVWIEELALDPWARALEWSQPPDPARLQRFSVIVIGAGFAGLTAALMLKRAGIPYVVYEKNEGVGGTWWENRYPGARLDTPSRSYMNIFGVDYPYPSPYCAAADNKRYFEWVADEFGLRESIVFRTEVRSLTWDEESATWDVEVHGPNGAGHERANAVISAVGYLNRPMAPEIEGRDDFEGPSWHSARWPEGFDLSGKRIAVIGTGCTGYQMIPELAQEAHHVIVFQRTPQWVWPVEGYTSQFPWQVKWLDRNFPFHTNFMRLRTMVRLSATARMTDIDPDFHDPHTLSPVNKQMRDAAIAFLESKIDERELIAKMTPVHPPWSARPVMADTGYGIFDALQRDDVTLVTTGIRRIAATGIEANDGTVYDVDAIVYATGFHATNYLFPMRLAGRNGRTLEEFWKVGGARAYRFCMIPGFPNLWILYGPNTNGGLGPGAYHEMATSFALRCIEKLILEGKRSIDANEDAYWEYNRIVDDRNSRKVWSDPRARNYYWTEHGRSAVQSPWNFDEIWALLRKPNFDELTSR